MRADYTFHLVVIVDLVFGYHEDQQLFLGGNGLGMDWSGGERGRSLIRTDSLRVRRSPGTFRTLRCYRWFPLSGIATVNGEVPLSILWNFHLRSNL